MLVPIFRGLIPRDKIHKFSMGANKMLIKIKYFEVTNEDTKEKSNNPLVIYCIAGKKTDQNQVNKCMDESITQFLKQFSNNEIASEEPSKPFSNSRYSIPCSAFFLVSPKDSTVISKP